MECLQAFRNKGFLKSVLLNACDHTSVFWRFFAPKLSKTLYRVKISHAEFFKSLIPAGFIAHFSTSLIETVLMPCLTFNTAGRLIASLAYIVCLLDHCKKANADFHYHSTVLIDALHRRLLEESAKTVPSTD